MDYCITFSSLILNSYVLCKKGKKIIAIVKKVQQKSEIVCYYKGNRVSL